MTPTPLPRRIVRVAQMFGDTSPAAFSHICQRAVDRQIGGIGLPGGCLAATAYRASAPQACRSGQLQATETHGHLPRRCHTDLLRGRDHDTPSNETRILPRLDHSSKIVQGRIHIRTAHRLNESACHIVMLIAPPPHKRLIGCCLDGGNRDLAGAIITGYPRCSFQKRQRLTCITARQADKPLYCLL